MHSVRPVLDSKELFATMAALKASTGSLITNFYLGEAKIKELVSQQALYVVSEINGILIFRSKEDYFNLHFIANSTELLKRLVNATAVDKTMVVDLIYREQNGQQWREAFSHFTDYAVFQRMCKLPTPDTKTAMDQDVIAASPDDVQAIYDIIISQFDRFSEHLPSSGEILEAIKKQNILVIKNQKDLVAILFFENVGITSTLRYWYVDPAFRGQHLGSRLMNSYFACNQAAKRYILWVNRANTQTILKYQYYGYQSDGTVDTILLKRCGDGKNTEYSA